VVTDTLPLIRKVSGVIVVSSIRHASRDAAEQLRRELESLNAPLLGIVVNNAKRSLPSYYRPIAAGEADLTEAQK
jgi:Mrp family chromosome partitioning ATPase